MQLFYNPQLSKTDKTVLFPKEESRHIVKVLRKKEGDQVFVTNGKGLLFTAVITQANHNKCFAEITEYQETEARKYKLHLAVAPTKMNDRFEWFLEKATEIGIDEITPIICEHSERTKVKLNRFERVLQSALKQSLHYRIPVLNAPISFEKFIEENSAKAQKFIAHCEEGPRKSLKNQVELNKSYTILIGPEGDFSPVEIEKALNNNYIPISLGNSRLRTETAAIVACHSIAFMHDND